MDDHISEDELALYAFSADAVHPDRKAAIEHHTAACPSCRATRDFFAVAEEDLGDFDMWERVAGSATRASLAAYAQRIADEDEEAEELLEPFLDSPGKTARTNLLAQRRFRTGGVVRRLTTHAATISDGEPLAALTFADAAICIAEALPDDIYPGRAVYELRGRAWEERGYAQCMLGEFKEALDSLTHAERMHKHLISPSLGLARVTYSRANVLYEQQHLNEAADMAERAEHGFAHLGDDDQRMKAVYLRACIRYEARDLESALSLFQQVMDYGEAIEDSAWIARSSNALGKCHVLRGNLSAASMHFHKALVLFREIGPASERVSTEWGIAKVLLQAGKRSEAIRRLRDVAAEFQMRGMITDAALVGLDIADALLGMGQTQQIVDLASRLFRVFTNAGMLTGALSALAYIKEAAAAGSLTPDDLDAVRGFLRRAERQPALLFVPPPPKNR
jgi:tetratricopeptide (TPR) repeat protein